MIFSSQVKIRVEYISFYEEKGDTNAASPIYFWLPPVRGNAFLLSRMEEMRSPPYRSLLSLYIFEEDDCVRESQYQAGLIKRLQKIFPGCFILKNDSSYKQGVPDLLILYKDKWALLECKRSEDSSKRPNQQYYIDILNKMSFASFISPENEKEVFDGLCKVFGT